jgi:3-hydroxy-3-methylglutaryl CoA synthase
VIFAPHQKSSAFIFSKNPRQHPATGRLMIYPDRIFNCSSIQYTQLYVTHNAIRFLPVNLQSQSPEAEAAGRAQVNQTIFKVCAMLAQSCSFMNSQSISSSLKCARIRLHVPTTKFAAKRLKLIKIAHQILLKWLTRTIESTYKLDKTYVCDHHLRDVIKHKTQSEVAINESCFVMYMYHIINAFITHIISRCRRELP